MESKLVLYNTLTRRKEVFEPLTPGRVGMYVCGPTVYGDPHLGHARPAVTFDLMFRYLKSCGYKVRYVRFRVVTSTTSSPTRASWTGRATSATPMTSRCGRRHRPSISCAGLRRGERGSPAGIWSARR